jgi:hypothetical protein
LTGNCQLPTQKMITAQTKIDLRLFQAPISLTAKAGKTTIFEGHSDFENGKFSPDLDKAIMSICKTLGINSFLKTDVKLTAVFAHYNLSENRLFVKGIIPLAHSNATLILNYQPSKTNPKVQDFAVVLDFAFFFDLTDLPIVANELDEQLHLTLAFANNQQTFETIEFEDEFKNKKTQKISVNSGVSLKTNIDFPTDIFEFDYELIDFTPQPETPTDLSADLDNLPKLPEQKGTKWFDLNKNMGGLNFRKIGMRWHQNKAWVLLNLDFMSSGLEFSMLGLQAGSSLNLKTFKPEFDLYGIGVYFKNNFVELGGSLLKNAKKSNLPTAYVGKMMMRLSSMSIGAIGGLTKTETGDRSFFAFANVGVPLGGIPAFFVTGLSAGFGYNSELNLPSVQNIPDYPLLNIIKTGQKSPSEALAYLGNIVSAKKDEKWLAAGIQFSSFQLIKSSAVLAYQFGKKEITILGVSRLVLPSENAAYLNLQFGLKAIYRIETGEIQSNAEIANGSFLIHKSVQLDGSVAVYTWLKGENAGDFVLTIGGYHPRFNRPSHYPIVPKVGFSWMVSDTTKIEGNTYFALTSQAIMAGFNFDATYEKGKIKAWFRASSDLILQWKPFYYDFQTKIRLGAKYESLFLKNYKLDVGADLHLYGPEMGGYVNINWTVISFNIKFGNPDKARFIYVLDWEMFQNNFLPQEEKDVCRVTVINGLVGESEKSNCWIVNPNNLAFSTQSLIPSNSLVINNQNIEISSDTLGIRPMNKRQLNATQTVTIREKATNNIIKINFKHEVKTTNFSPALWSAKALNRQQLDNEKLQSVSGFEYLMPVATPNGNLTKVKNEVFEKSQKSFLCQFDNSTEQITAKIENDKKTILSIATSINSTKTVENRTAIINDLNQYFQFADTDILPNDALIEFENNAEQIFQSEPKIGQIQRNETEFAIPKMMVSIPIKAVEKQVTATKPTMRLAMRGIGNGMNFMDLQTTSELNTRSIQATATSKKVYIKANDAYVFEFNKSDTKRTIKFKSEVPIQVIEFNEYNHILGFHILEKSTKKYKALPKTSRLALRSATLQYGQKNNTAPESIGMWKSTDIMPLVNDNALLGDRLYVQLQVPMADDEATHGTVEISDRKNFINIKNGIQKGFIDTIIFQDYQTLIVIAKQKGQAKPKKVQLQETLQVTIPCTYTDNFTRQLNQNPPILRPKNTAIDGDGFIRIKYKIANKKIGRKSESDFDWNAFVLRIQATEDWEVKGILLFRGRVKKAIWLKE